METIVQKQLLYELDKDIGSFDQAKRALLIDSYLNEVDAVKYAALVDQMNHNVRIDDLALLRLESLDFAPQAIIAVSGYNAFLFKNEEIYDPSAVIIVTNLAMYRVTPRTNLDSSYMKPPNPMTAIETQTFEALEASLQKQVNRQYGFIYKQVMMDGPNPEVAFIVQVPIAMPTKMFRSGLNNIILQQMSNESYQNIQLQYMHVNMHNQHKKLQTLDLTTRYNANCEKSLMLTSDPIKNANMYDVATYHQYYHNKYQPFIKHIPEADIIAFKPPSTKLVEYNVNELELRQYKHTLICLVLDSMVKQQPIKLIYNPPTIVMPITQQMRDDYQQFYTAIELIYLVAELVYQRQWTRLSMLIDYAIEEIASGLSLPLSNVSTNLTNYNKYQKEVQKHTGTSISNHYLDIIKIKDKCGQFIASGNKIFTLILVEDQEVQEALGYYHDSQHAFGQLLEKYQNPVTSNLIQNERSLADCETLWNRYITNNIKIYGDELLEIRLPGLNAFAVQLKTEAVVKGDLMYILSEIACKIAREVQHQNAFYQFAYAGGVGLDVLNTQAAVMQTIISRMRGCTYTTTTSTRKTPPAGLKIWRGPYYDYSNVQLIQHAWNMLQGQPVPTAPNSVENALKDACKQYQEYIDNYNEELRVYKCDLQAKCRESNLDIAGADAKNATITAGGITNLWVQTKEYVLQALLVINPFVNIRNNNSNIIGEFMDDAQHMRLIQHEYQNDMDFNFQVPRPSIERLIFTLDRKLAEIHKMQITQFYNLALDLPVLYKTIENRELDYQEEAKQNPPNKNSSRWLMRYKVDQFISLMTPKLQTELIHQSIQYPRYNLAIKAMHKYLLNKYTNGTVVDYITIESNLFQNSPGNVLILDWQHDVGAGIVQKPIHANMEVIYKRCLHPIIIYKPILDHVYDTKQQRAYKLRLTMKIPDNHIQPAGLPVPHTKPSTVTIKSYAEWMDSQFVYIYQDVDTFVRIEYPIRTNKKTSPKYIDSNALMKMYFQYLEYIRMYNAIPPPSTDPQSKYVHDQLMQLDASNFPVYPEYVDLYDQFKEFNQLQLTENHFQRNLNFVENSIIINMSEIDIFPTFASDYYAQLEDKLKTYVQELYRTAMQGTDQLNAASVNIPRENIILIPSRSQHVRGQMIHPPQSMPEPTPQFQDIYRKEFKGALASISAKYKWDPVKRQFILELTNITENTNPPSVPFNKTLVIDQLGPSAFGVLDYIKLPSGKSVAVECRIQAIGIYKSSASTYDVVYPSILKTQYQATTSSNKRQIFEQKLLTDEGPQFFNVRDNIQMNIASLLANGYDATQDKLKSTGIPDSIYVRNQMQLQIQGFAVADNVNIGTELKYQLGDSTSTLTVDNQFDANYTMLRSIYISRAAPQFGFNKTSHNARAFIKHIYTEIQQHMYMKQNAGQYKEKGEFVKEFMRMLPADLKVPIPSAIDPTKIPYKTDIDLLHKPVDILGGRYQWTRWDLWQNVILNSHEHLKDLKEIFYHVSTINTGPVALVLIYLLILFESELADVYNFISRANTTDPQLRHLLRHAGELLCLSMHNFSNTNRPDTVQLNGGTLLQFGIYFYNVYDIPKQTEIQNYQKLLVQYTQTYKELNQRLTVTSYNNTMKDAFANRALEIKNAGTRPTLEAVYKYSNTAFGSLPVFGNVSQIVTSGQIDGEGYRILVFNPTKPPNTALYKWYKKGTFDGQVGSDTQQGGYNYKAMWCVTHIPYNNTYRTSPLSPMYVVDDIQNYHANGDRVDQLAGVVERNASGQNDIGLYAIVLKYEGPAPVIPPSPQPFDLTTVKKHTFNAVPDTHVIADLQKYITDQSASQDVIVLGFDQAYKDAWNVQMRPRDQDQDVDDQYHYIKHIIQNKYESSKDKLVIVNSVPRQVASYYSTPDALIKQFLVYNILKVYNDLVPKDLPTAYLTVETKMEADLDIVDKTLNPPMPPGPPLPPVSLLIEPRLYKIAEELVQVNGLAVAKGIITSHMGDLKKNVFGSLVKPEESPVNLNTTTFLFIE